MLGLQVRSPTPRLWDLGAESSLSRGSTEPHLIGTQGWVVSPLAPALAVLRILYPEERIDTRGTTIWLGHSEGAWNQSLVTLSFFLCHQRWKLLLTQAQVLICPLTQRSLASQE